ncbi:MAG: methyltransferase domain-containing protein [Spirochaetes bacterium]|nr:methyltransferase domain-containing protein [Spirochaetota bacterium]
MSNNKISNEFRKNIRSLNLSKDILNAFESVDRTLFFDPFFIDKINGFDPIPLGYGEYSDDVTLLSKMLTILSPSKNWDVLEIGTGSGYSTALLSTMVKKILTVEYNEKLAIEAKERLMSNGFFNIKFLAGDCSELDDRAGSFDAVIVYAGCMHSPYAALNLLKKNGVAVFPMGTEMLQQIIMYKNIPLAPEDNPYKRYKFLDTCTIQSIKGVYGFNNKAVDIIVQTGEGGS